MRIFNLLCADIYKGLAVEELLFESDLEQAILIWRSKPAIILGKHQDIYNEVNIEYANSNNIDLARRSSGGGTVYHDLGNVNIAFFDNQGSKMFKQSADKLVEILRLLGVNVKLNERMALHCNNLKVSGSAQRLRKDRAMFHATMLFDANLKMLNGSISTGNNPIPCKKFRVESVREEVGNIKEILGLDYDIIHFISLINNKLEQLFHTKTEIDLPFDNQCLDEKILSLKDKQWIYNAKRYGKF